MKNSVWKNIWKKRKWPKQIFLTCIMLSLLMATATGCSRLPILSQKDKTCLYYVNPEKTGLVEEEYDLQGSTALEQAKQILTELKQTPDKEKMQPSIPKGVEVKDVKLSGKKLTVDLSEEYLKLDTIQSACFGRLWWNPLYRFRESVWWDLQWEKNRFRMKTEMPSVI